MKKYTIQRLKAINGKEPEVIIPRDFIIWAYNEIKDKKDISAVVPYLKEVKE